MHFHCYMEMFDANRISTVETDTEKAAYCSNNSISSHLYTILLYMVQKHIGKNHSINWKNASFVFNDKSEEVLQMVESIHISKLSNIKLSSGFIAFPIILRRI